MTGIRNHGRWGFARRWAGRGALVLTLAGGGTAARAAGQADRQPDAAPVREPEIRHLYREKDRADLDRIWHFRKKLPEPFYRRNNFGWARADIPGLRKKEYFAHSGIQNLEGFSREVAQRLKGMSFSPAKGEGRFQTLLVDYLGNIDGPDALPRWFDTEYKILEDIASRLPDPAVKGSIRLYTNLEPCPSCRGVMRQFLAAYTNIDMLVMYEWPP